MGQFKSQQTKSITSGQTYSEAVDVGAAQSVLAGIHFPVMTSTAVTFEWYNFDSASWVRVMDVSGAAVHSVTVSGTAGYVPVDPRVFNGLTRIRAVCGTNEASTRTVYFVFSTVA